MDDVKNQNVSAPEATVEPETTAPEPQQVEKTEAHSQEPERMIPYKRFQEVNSGYNELKRKIAEMESKTKLSQYSEDDMNNIMAHPFVQELLIKQAKSELNDYAKELLDQYPSVPEVVRKAILTNVRGFVKETTTDVESAKIDLEEYINQLVEQTAPTVTPKTIPVAPTKATEVTSGANPAQVQKILEKPMDEWTEDDAKIVEQYKKTMPRGN